jgi:hypothetical protein
MLIKPCLAGMKNGGAILRHFILDTTLVFVQKKRFLCENEKLGF